MKKIILAVAMVLFATSAFGATAVERTGINGVVTQYKIDDLGGDYHNHLIYESLNVCEVVIQTSSIIYTTSKENYLCWCDESVECPDDDIDGGTPGVQPRMPVLYQLEQIRIANSVTAGATLSDLASKAIYRAFWYEYVIKGRINTIMADSYFTSLNALQQKRNLKSVYYGNGVDVTTAQTIADAYIDGPTEPTHNDLGLATVSLQYRRMLILFGEVGWFE